MATAGAPSGDGEGKPRPMGEVAPSGDGEGRKRK